MEITSFGEQLKNEKAPSRDYGSNFVRHDDIMQIFSEMGLGGSVEITTQSPFSQYSRDLTFLWRRPVRIYHAEDIALLVEPKLGRCLGEPKERGEEYPLVLVTKKDEKEYYDERKETGQRLMQASAHGRAPPIMYESMIERIMPFYLEGPHVTRRKDNNLETMVADKILVQFRSIDLRMLNTPKWRRYVNETRKKYRVGIQSLNDGNESISGASINDSLCGFISWLVEAKEFRMKNDREWLALSRKRKDKEGQKMYEEFIRKEEEEEIMPVVLSSIVETEKDAEKKDFDYVRYLKKRLMGLYSAGNELKKLIKRKGIKEAMIFPLY